MGNGVKFQEKIQFKKYFPPPWFYVGLWALTYEEWKKHKAQGMACSQTLCIAGF
jgi:hypothetical protein